MRYRVWCNNKEEYERHQVFLTPEGALYHRNRCDRLQPLNQKTHIIERCTGIRDNSGWKDGCCIGKGALIYEGDKLKDAYGEVYIVEFRRDRWLAIVVGEEDAYLNLGSVGDQCRIIGTIHDDVKGESNEDK